jgi:myosin-7
MRLRFTAQAFEDLWKAMIVLKIDENIIEGIFSVVSAVLHIGNLTFEDIDGESVGLTAADKKVVETVAKLLKVRFDMMHLRHRKTNKF